MLMRDDVVKKIQEKIAGKITSIELGEWAWTQLWNEETGKNRYDDNYLGVISDTLQKLVHLGEPYYVLSKKDLNGLINRLKIGSKIKSQWVRACFKCGSRKLSYKQAKDMLVEVGKRYYNIKGIPCNITCKNCGSDDIQNFSSLNEYKKFIKLKR